RSAPPRFGAIFDLDAARSALSRLREKAAEPDFWTRQEEAQAVLRETRGFEKRLGRAELLDAAGGGGTAGGAAGRAVGSRGASAGERACRDGGSRVARGGAVLRRRAGAGRQDGSARGFEQRLALDSRRGRRNRVAGLGRDAPAHVHALRGTARLEGGADRSAGRGRGGGGEGDPPPPGGARLGGSE